MGASRKYGRLKAACYATNMSMSVVANLPPILFLGFHELYGISYGLLGLLVLINFSTQLLVDLLLSFFSHKINMSAAVKLTPVMTVVGLMLFAAAPLILPDATYLGLVLGVVVFAASNGFAEVLISPVIAALPAPDPEREVSKLHSIYAWGVVAVVPICSLLLLAFGISAWQWIALGSAIVPLVASLLFIGTTLPELKTPERAGGTASCLKRPMLWLSVAAIFLGGATECTMSQWSSSYLEGALGIDKIYGDIFGVTLFALMLATGRTLYSKIGSNPERVLLFGSIGALLCYLASALAPHPVVGLVACALTGLCASMLWPGTLIVGAERIPEGGVMVYALMAAGGDLGASVGPQLVGSITDAVSASGLPEALGVLPDELGLRIGMLTASLFPLFAIVAYVLLLRSRKKATQKCEISSENPAECK